MNGITILGTGEYTPETVVTNEMFTKFIDKIGRALVSVKDV